ncbi:MAG: MmgE/PrpD family protein [Bryobacteraceae bacterium]
MGRRLTSRRFAGGRGCVRSGIIGLDLHQTLHAMGIAASEAAGLRENFGAMAKPFQSGRAAESGIVVAELAALGAVPRERNRRFRSLGAAA